MVATVEDGRLTKLRPDPDHPLSRGFACPKGIAMTEVQNDPDRVLHPLRRRADGSTSSASPGTRRWTRSARRLRRASATEHGGDAVGWYIGNPGAFCYSHPLWVKGFLDGARLAALLHRLLAGRHQPLRRQRAALRLAVHRPDPRPRAHRLPAHRRRQPARLARQRAQRAADQGPAARDRRPRRARRRRRPAPHRDRRARSSTSPVHPDADAWLLLSLLHVIFAEGLEDARRDRRAVERRRGAARARRAGTRRSATEARDRRPGRRPSASSPATSPRAERAAVYGRTGTCLGPQRHAGRVPARRAQRSSTGNLDREGGAMFGDPPIPTSTASPSWSALGTYGKRALADRRPPRGARHAARRR